MVEAIFSGLVSMVVFAYGYGRLSEKVKNLESQIGGHSTDLEDMQELKTSIAEIKRDIAHIKEKIDE
jgi:hypothetical protein